MQLHYWWWLAALGLGIVEMLTGTFYLLVLAFGCAAAGLAAYAGLGLVGQLIVAAGVSLAGWAMLRRWRPAGRSHTEASGDRDVLLDIGERVMVTAWDASGHASVSYRGARWDAELAVPQHGTSPAPPGQYQIRAILGNRLQLIPVAPEPPGAEPERTS
jgi:membrane protein implicated in regulation of membrane protease activity